MLGKICKHASCTGADDMEMLTRAVREQMSKASLLARRTLCAYPGLKLYNGELLEKMRQKRQEIQQKAMDAPAKSARIWMSMSSAFAKRFRKKERTHANEPSANHLSAERFLPAAD